MLDKIASIDTELFIYLNSLGSEKFDGLWLMITQQTNWIPLFVILLYVIYSKVGAKQSLYLLLFVAVLLVFTDQSANFFKYEFQRLRPCSNPEINTKIRIVKSSATFSFFSGHAANSMAVATFLFLKFKKNFNYLWLLFLWPLCFSSSATVLCFKACLYTLILLGDKPKIDFNCFFSSLSGGNIFSL